MSARSQHVAALTALGLVACAGRDERAGVDGTLDGDGRPALGGAGDEGPTGAPALGLDGGEARPDCDDEGCRSVCGDGLVLGEECDDGNLRDGDGCSRSCGVERGFTCELGRHCSDDGSPCTLQVPVTFHDFRPGQPQDFEVGCGTLTTGVVKDRLDARDKPVLANGGPACIGSAASFASWFTRDPLNREIEGVLTLYQTDAGSYVNRHGARGQPWRDPSGQSYDGDPLFFPIDDAPQAFADERHPAKIPEQYGYPGWPWEETLHPDEPAPLHNFSFTTEVVSWFMFDGTRPATLEFSGDDDVWVFVNGRLAVDLGGCHVPTTGQVTLDASSAARFGLQQGKLYRMHVFHAERKREGSSFKLTLAGFDLRRSECRPTCGDGIVAAGEACDDGNRHDGDACPSDCLSPLL